MDTQWVVVFPDHVVGFFDSEDDAKEYVQAMFGHIEEAYNDLTWSIKPVRAP